MSADQGKVLITRAVPASSAVGTAISGAGTTSATLRAIGFMSDSTDATETVAPVQIGGTCKAIFGASIAAGKVCKSDANGKLVEVAGDGSDDYLACAISLESGSDTELHDVKIL